MRIISDFNDYYDVGMSYGSDPNLVFKRFQDYADLKKPPFDGYLRPNGSAHDLIHKHFIGSVEPFKGDFNNYYPSARTPFFNFGWVGFCGYFYPFVRCSLWCNRDFPPKGENPIYLDNDKNHHHIFNGDELPYINKGRVYFPNGDIRNIANHHRCDDSLISGDIKRAKQFLSYGAIANNEPFFSLSAPIIVVHNDRLLRRIYDWPFKGAIGINEQLKDVEFYKVIDAFNAFQQLSQYISGVLGVNQPETVDVSDETLRDAKGFDDRSFKIGKGVKKPRRRKSG